MNAIGKNLLTLLSLCAACTALQATPASAAVIAYDNRVDFNAAIADFSGIFTEEFDSTPSGTNITNGTNLNGITYSYVSPFAGNNMQVTNTALALTNPNTMGVYYSGGGYTGGFAPSDDVTLTFDNPVSAFGIWFSTGEHTPGSNRVTTSNGDIVLSGYDPKVSGGDGQYAGLISDTPFTSVKVEGLALFGYNIDSITTAIPEPSGLLLFAVAMGLVGLRHRGRTGNAHPLR